MKQASKSKKIMWSSLEEEVTKYNVRYCCLLFGYVFKYKSPLNIPPTAIFYLASLK
jgi:hypothetical protein